MESTDFRHGVGLMDRVSASNRYWRSTPGTWLQGRPGAVFGGGAPMTATGSFEFNAMPDAILLGWLTANGHRPNVLIECQEPSADIATRHLMTWCALPFRYCALPGKLELPTTRKGTLLLKDVAALSLPQQVMLYDWLSAAGGDMQVISRDDGPPTSVSSKTASSSKGLFYRLNVIRLDAMHGTRPAPLDTWQETGDRMA